MTEDMTRTQTLDVELAALHGALSEIKTVHAVVSGAISKVTNCGIDTEDQKEELEYFASLVCEICEAEGELENAITKREIKYRTELAKQAAEGK
jgi:hypothetical protein